MQEFSESDEELKSLITSIDKKLKNKDSFYLDVEEINIVVDYYVEKGFVKKAISVLKVGLSLHPNSTEIWMQMSQVYCVNGEYATALKWINKVQNFEPQRNEIHLIKAEIFGFQHKHEKSIIHYLKYMENASKEDKEMVYNDIAWEYESCNDYENALKYLKLALKLNPEEDTVLFEIAYFYEMLEQPEKSIKFYEEFIDENPYSYNAWYNLGNILSDLEKFEKAIVAFDYASIIKENFSSAFFNKGNAHFKLKQYQESLECYFKTFEYEDNQPITYCYIGECYEKLNNYNESEKYYELALFLNENIIEGLIGITLIKDKKNETAQGLPYIEKACSVHSENTECWYILAEVNEKLDKIEEAFDAYQKAYSFSPENVQLVLDYSNFLAENYSVNQAIDLIKDMDSIKLKYRLVAYYFVLGEKNEALSLFEKCLVTEYALHQELLEYHPEITKYPNFMKLVEELK